MRRVSTVGRTWMISSAILVGSAALAWGAPAGNRSPVSTVEPQPVPGRGDERLVWEQPASSAREITTLRFVVYVDGRRQSLPAVGCASEAGPDGFACSAPLPSLLPGVHVVEVAAFGGSNAAEGFRSAPIVLRVGTGGMGAAQQRATATSSDTSRDTPAQPLDETWSTSDGVRLRAIQVVDGLHDVTDILPLPDGRVLVGERGGRIRLVRAGVLLAPDAANLGDISVGEGRGLLSLARDRDFVATGHVFALYTTDAGLRVSRYVLRGETLVDRAVLIDALPVAAVRPAAQLRTGPDGRLYLALDDGGDPERLMDMGSYSGKVLRFALDGTTPDDQGLSPVWSVGVARPVGLAWSADRATLRLVGDESSSGRVPSGTGMQADARGREVVTRFSVTTDLAVAGAAVAGAVPGALQGHLLVASRAERGILRVWFGDDDRPAGSEWLLRDLPGPVTAVAVAPDGAIYAAVGPMLVRITVE